VSSKAEHEEEVENPFDDAGDVDDMPPFVTAKRFSCEVLELDGEEVETEPAGANCAPTPIFLGHGRADEKVAIGLGALIGRRKRPSLLRDMR
jgi:hypothetical protein